MHADLPSELLNVQGVAVMLALSPRSIYRLADAGTLPRPLKIGGAVRWRRKSIIEFLDAAEGKQRAVEARR
ncbi:MAG: helix-turn-helix domain-containing protein [Candidatus Hydrogenedentes bacterium]|nr:helix-turn-helix domain-containing protein [Candidatus Hydrogenedentota bacterium]